MLKVQFRAALYETFRVHQPLVKVDFQVTAKGKHVDAADKYLKDSLKLVPYSQNIFGLAVEGSEEAEKKTCGTHINMKLVRKETYICTFNAASAPKQDIKSSMPFANALLIPYWLVATTNDPSIANMQYSVLKNVSVVTVDGESSRTVVTMPIMVNSKTVKEGDELLVLESKMESNKRPEAIEPAESAPKKKARKS